MKAKIACLALFTSALFSNDVIANTITTYHKAECQRGNFYGELKYEKQVTGNTVRFKTNEYKLTRFHGQKGGNKANINIASTYQDRGANKNVGIRSPDNIRQDGQWRVYGTWLDIPSSASNKTFKVEFIFDKSGSDPRCSVTHQH